MAALVTAGSVALRYMLCSRRGSEKAFGGFMGTVEPSNVIVRSMKSQTVLFILLTSQFQ
jgi:hypothetical protein